jgi:hypothetical protein
MNQEVEDTSKSHGRATAWLVGICKKHPACFVRWQKVALLHRMLPAWPEFLKASGMGAAVSLAISKVKASVFAARPNNLPKYIVVASAAVAAAVFLVARRSMHKSALHRLLNRGQGKFREYPALRGSDDDLGFTATSIRTRLPRILDDIIATMPVMPEAALKELQALRLEISSNGIISGLPKRICASGSESGALRVNEESGGDQEPDWPS